MTNPITLKEQVREEFNKKWSVEGRGISWKNNLQPDYVAKSLNALIDRTALAVLQMVEEQAGTLEAPFCEKKHGSRSCGKRIKNLMLDEFLARISALKDSFSGEGV